ncbi:hypothetical protein HDE_00591 [Halotydeus destructor]|nr:hypothetical protein HDE_00591 [Halotydeus destructor]
MDKLEEVRRDELNQLKLLTDLKKTKQKNVTGDAILYPAASADETRSKLLTAKLEANDSTNDLPPLTPGQRKLGHLFFLLKIVVSICNLGCFVLKLPFLVFVIRAALEVLRMKQKMAAATTLEPPYGDYEGMHLDYTVETAPATNGSSAGAKIEVLCLLLLYVGMLVVHLDVGCILFCTSKCKGALHLMLYFPMVGTWLFFACFSYLVDQWSSTFQYIFLVFKFLIHGTDLLQPPDTWELALLRSSLMVDVLTFILTIAYLGVSLVWKRKKLPPHCVQQWKPHYNLIRLL